MSVVAWTIGAVISAGRTPALARTPSTPVRTPSSGAAGVVSVLSTTTRPDAASSSTASVNVPPMSTARRQSEPAAEVLARRGEDVEDPHLVELVVADEHAVAVPDASRREVDLAGAQHGSLGRVLGADAEVERAAHDDAELLLVVVVVEDRPLGAALDPPEAELQRLAGDHAAAEPGAVGLGEGVVVEEVAVLVGQVGGRIHHTSRSSIRRSTSVRWSVTAATVRRRSPRAIAAAIARWASVALRMICSTSRRFTSA